MTKQVLIIRHADWDLKTDALTEDAKAHSAALKPKLPPLARVLSSPYGRATETAKILAGKDPQTDDRIAFPNLPDEVKGQIVIARRTHPLGVGGVIFAIPAAREPYHAQANLFFELVQYTLGELKDGETALMVSHDGIMLALEKVLDNASFEGTGHVFGELEGFYLDDQLNQTPFKP